MPDTGTLKVTTPSDREIVLTRAFDAPRQLVWDAFTQPELLQRWLLGPSGWSMIVCDVALKAGEAYRYVWRHTNGNEMTIKGICREVVIHERIVSTESWGGDWPDTLNTIVFAEENGKTTVTNTILYPSKKARDAALKTGMTKGVAASYNRLAELLAPPARAGRSPQ